MLSPQIKKVLPQGTNNLVTYNYYDLAEGTGITVFYGAKTNTDGKKITNQTSGAFYILTTSPVYSDNVCCDCQASDLDTTFVKVQDIDFDCVFNLPKRIKGNSFIMLSHGANAVTAATTTTTFVQARIRKYDGTTETDLSVASGAQLAVAAVANNGQTVCLKANIPETNFKKGDTLRLTIENWAKNAAAADADIGFGIDPQDRDEPVAARPISGVQTTQTTKLEFHVPFVIDA